MMILQNVMRLLPELFLLLILAICFYTDIKERKIYNKVILVGLVLGLFIVLYSDGLQGLLSGVKGMALGIGLLFIPFALGGIGAGDVKLLGLIGFMKGTEFVFITFLYAALLGGLMSLLLLIYQRRLLAAITNILIAFKILLLSKFKVNTLPGKDEKNQLTVPYAPAIVIASFLAYFYPDLINLSFF